MIFKTRVCIFFFFFLLFFFLTMQIFAAILIAGSLTHEKESTPGAVYHDSIVINNANDEPAEVKLYQTDYEFFADGRILYGDPGRMSCSNAGWIMISPKQLTIPPNETATVYYSVNVPDDKTLTGTYWSIIMIEGIGKDSIESSAVQPEIGVGVKQVFRYGLQVITQIGSTGEKKIKFSAAKLLKEDEKTVLQIDVAAIGERYVKAVLWTELYGKKGELTGKYEGGAYRIFPGSSVRFKVDINAPEPGTYRAVVMVDYGGPSISGAVYNLTIN